MSAKWRWWDQTERQSSPDIIDVVQSCAGCYRVPMWSSRTMTFRTEENENFSLYESALTWNGTTIRRGTHHRHRYPFRSDCTPIITVYYRRYKTSVMCARTMPGIPVGRFSRGKENFGLDKVFGKILRVRDVIAVPSSASHPAADTLMNGRRQRSRDDRYNDGTTRRRPVIDRFTRGDRPGTGRKWKIINRRREQSERFYVRHASGGKSPAGQRRSTAPDDNRPDRPTSGTGTSTFS